MKKHKIKIILLLTFIIQFCAFAQSGISYSEFLKRAEDYFNSEMITDLSKAFSNPQRITIWSWDVGDFSGDNISDLAFTYRISGDREQRVYLRMYADIDGFLVNVSDFPYKFIELPLEVGTNIKDGTCYVSQKIQNGTWKIYGYRLLNGAVIFKEEFTSEKIDNLSVDNTIDYYNLTHHTKIINDKSKVLYENKYYNIPSYHRGRLIFHGYSNKVVINDVDFVPRGAYWWNGEQDCKAEITSAYDEDFIYFQFNIYDDIIIKKMCDSCYSDYISVWFDLMNIGEVVHYIIKNNKVLINDTMSRALYNFVIYPGDFKDIPAYVQAYSSDNLTSIQQISASQIKAVSNLTENGYIVKAKIPLSILGVDPTFLSGEFYKIACSIEIHDIDNEFRPEEESVLATSKFNYANSSTFGAIIFVPSNQWYGECSNIYRQDIYQALLEFGY